MIPGIVAAPFVIDHHIQRFLPTVMAENHSTKMHPFKTQGYLKDTFRDEGYPGPPFN